MNTILLATDLDRTVIPNGADPESPSARPLFTKLAALSRITLLYVSGRNKSLQQEAITEYDLPLPDYAVGDVGTTIYQVGKTASWQPLSAWENTIAPDWHGRTWHDIHGLFANIKEIRLQDDDPAFQNKFKVSYYTDKQVNRDSLITAMKRIAAREKLNLSFIFSIDEAKNVGLLDVLPKSATKLHAIEFLRATLNLPRERAVFCGDSGNDIPALISGLNAVMVKNTSPEVQDEVNKMAVDLNIVNQIYTAQGDFFGMNGNYCAGVIEGVTHFFPEVGQLIQLGNSN